MSTLSALQSLLSRYLGATYIYNPDQQTAALNYARKHILLNYYVDEFAVQATLTLTTGRASIPSDYLRHVKLYDSSDTEYQRVNVNNFDKDTSQTWTIKDSSGTRYIYIYPTTATSLTLRYLKLPTDMSATSDLYYFRAYFDDALCAVAAWWLLNNDRQPEAQNKLAAYEEMLQTALRHQAEESEDYPVIETIYDQDIKLFDN